MAESELRPPAPATDAEFERFRRLVDDNEEWVVKLDKADLSVWMKDSEGTTLKMSKARFVYEDISPAVLYDLLHDPYYRRVWDDNMIDGFEICSLDATNDIGYYSLKCPTPMTNRDYVNQRSWRVAEDEYIIFNRSVIHPQLPPRKPFIRAVSLLTGYIVRPHDSGSVLYYVAHSDPKGSIPNFITNFVVSKIAPKFATRIHKAALGYEEWKAQHNPSFKPWLHPEQVKHLTTYDESLSKQLVDANGKLLVKSTAEEESQLEGASDELNGDQQGEPTENGAVNGAVETS